jgi:hypothetical protein
VTNFAVLPNALHPFCFFSFFAHYNLIRLFNFNGGQLASRTKKKARAESSTRTTISFQNLGGHAEQQNLTLNTNERRSEKDREI